MDDRRLRDGEYPLRRILLIWAVVAILLLATAWQNILRSQFPDPDDVLRLVQVRDLLAGQDWFDLKQYRIDPTGTVPMHWSRLVDIPLALIIAALTPIMGQGLAEQIAIVAVPLLALLVAMLFLGRLAWRLFDVETAGLACLSVGFLPMLMFQFQPLRIDHHGWQICAVIAAVWAISGRNAWGGGAIAGFAMAAGIVISLELLPIAAIVGGVLALRWLRDRGQRFWLVGYLQSLALALAALFLLTRGIADLAPYCDAITLPHIGFFLVVALGATALSVFRPVPWFFVALGLGLSAAVGLAFFGANSPGCLRTPFGELDPLVSKYWYVNVPEGQPAWKQVSSVLPVMIQILAAFLAAGMLALRSHDWKRAWWLEYLLLYAGMVVLGLLVWRSMAFASILAALPLGYLLKTGLDRFRTGKTVAIRLGVITGLLALLAPSLPVALAQKLAADGSGASEPIAQSSCDLFESARKLESLGPGTVFAPLDIGPAIIQQTSHAVVATGHHRAEKAMRDVIAAHLGTPEEARTIIRKHQARFVVMCTDLIEPDIYTEQGQPGNFASLLRGGNAPEWLEPVDLGTPGTFRVWRVTE